MDKKNIKVRDLKPTKDAKGGGGRAVQGSKTQGGHSTSGGSSTSGGHKVQGGGKGNR